MRARLAQVTGSIWSDVVLAGALLVLAEVELWGGATYEGEPVFPGPELLSALLVIPAITLPLAVRRTHPLASVSAVMAAVALSSLALGASEATSVFLTVLVSVYSATANGAPPGPVLGLSVGAIAVHQARNPHVSGLGEAIWVVGFLLVGWLFGLAVRGRHQRIATLQDEATRLATEREERARLAVAEERGRVARELHDVVAHAVSVVVVQAQAGQRLVGVDDDRARQSLVAIEETARSALDEMRRLLGLLRDADETSLAPQPGLAELGGLVAQLRDAGLAVEVEVEGGAVPLPPGVDLSAYRVIQEGLTNVLKHASASRAAVRIRYGEHDVELEVTDDGTAPRGPSAESGYGLVGIRERVELYGGSMESGARPAGGWRLQARIPVQT